MSTFSIGRSFKVYKHSLGMCNPKASSSPSRLSLSTLVLLLTLIQRTDAGVFYGGATSSDGCYGALQSSTRPDENVIDKDGYVLFINKLSNNAFTSFQYNEKDGEWGKYPVTAFNELPTAIKEEFYTHACGGPYVICENAFLYTDGMNGNGSTVIDPQQVVYLFEVCKGVEEAIEEATISATSIAPTPSSLPASTSMPTTIGSSSPTASDGIFTAEIPLNLTYQAAVSSFITVEELQMTNSTTRAQLLDAMTTWIMATARRFGLGVDGKNVRTSLLKGQRRSRGRRLVVYPEPLVEMNGTTLMIVMDVECREEMNVTIENTDHCIEVTTELMIQFEDEPIGSEIDILYLFEEEFENDIQDGTFLGFISNPSTKQEFRAIYPPVTMSELFEPGGGSNASPTSTPESEMLPPVVANADTLDKLIQDHDNAAESSSEGGKSSTAGIVSAACIGLILIGVALFVVRRRQELNKSFKGISGFEKRKFSPTDDLEGGNAQDVDSKHSSRDEFSSGKSDDSSSMQYYSGSESSSQSSQADDDSSQSDDDSTASSQSSEYDDRVNPYQKADPNLAHDAEGVARNAGRSAANRMRSSNGNMSSTSKSAGGSRAADDESSAGSSGWDSSDGNSSVDTSLADSYTGELSSSHSGRSDENSTTLPDQLPNMSNPVDNLLTQRGVTMIAVDEGAQEDIELTMISNESSSTDTHGREREQYPSEGDIQEAIVKGDWAAVGATAAIIASTDSTGISSMEIDDAATKDSSATSGSSHTDEDDARAAELAELVENGNWGGVVAVAARYADEADEADEQLEQPSLHNYARNQSSSSSRGYGSGTSMNDSSGSGMDASVETEDASSAGADNSQSSISRNSNLDEASVDGTAEGDADELSLPLTTTPGSSSASSSSASHVSQQEKQQANAYRVEVESLLRRVVPDEVDNIDDIMEQFSGREEELIETLRVMQEKSVAQRARAAVQRSAKREAGRANRDTAHDDDEDMDQSVETDGSYSYTTGSKSTDGLSIYSREESSTEYSTTVTDID